MSFKSAYLKLTFFYVLVVMFISIIFSVVLYQISTQELNRGLGKQNQSLQELPEENFAPQGLQRIEQIRLDQLNESGQRLNISLIDLNLLIFILSAGASYFFAKRTLRPIEEMMNRQNRFTADASHELRTPLTAMKTEIEVALRDKKINLLKSKKLLQSNLEEIEKLEDLSKALLTLARFEEKTLKNFEKVSLQELITEAFEKVEKMAELKKIKFQNSFQNLNVAGDKLSLVELFVILLDNAIKYSPAKKNSKNFITIKKSKKYAKVSIKDQGTGIPAIDLPHIFNRFYRADASRTKDKTSGFGLGLSIAKQIVELHKGSISVKSKPNVGSEFLIKLPIYKKT